MNVLNMVISSLKAAGMDGLYNVEEDDCGCLMEDDFILCGELHPECCGGLNVPVELNGFDFWVSDPDKALERWPECSECNGFGMVLSETGSTIVDCIPCRATGRVIRTNDDFVTLTELVKKFDIINQIWQEGFHDLLKKAWAEGLNVRFSPTGWDVSRGTNVLNGAGDYKPVRAMTENQKSAQVRYVGQVHKYLSGILDSGDTGCTEKAGEVS